MAFSRWQRLDRGTHIELNDYEPYKNSPFEDPLEGSSRQNHSSSDPLGVTNATPCREIPDSVGIPARKRRLHLADVLALFLSVICFVLAMLAVADNGISWRHGIKTYQLIVVGFLLSIMNLCLGTVAPTLFLLLEARYGASTLQNFDGLMRQQLLRPQLGATWRIVLFCAMALPLGLSAAYKSFTGGQSHRTVLPSAYIGNETWSGMFGPPGLQLLGQGSGISLFSNATLPFLLATSPTSNGSEPSLPIAPHAYGFNLLLLGNNSAAALDTPQPSYISSVQDLLATGESWNITASVNAVVAEFNNSKAEDPNKYQYFCVEFCDKAQRSSGAFTHQSMMNKQSLELANEPSPGPQTLQYLSFGPPGTDPGITYENTCEDFCTYSYLYSVNRRNCHGTWSVTRGGITLIDGNCDGNASPEVQQHVVDGNRLFLGVCYISSLTELLGAFVTNRNGSVWMSPYMATGVATMVWSRITAIDSAERRTTYNNTQKAASFVSDNDDTGAVKDASLEDLRIFYPAYNETVVYTRPTLLKSYWLYAVFALQPLLILVFLTLSLWLHSTPIAGGFGLISILAGLEPDSIRLLAGAGLSGDLEKPTKLIISTTHGSDANSSQGDVKYVVALPSQARWQNGKLKSGTTYH